VTNLERNYEETLVAYFEGEIEGETYFHGLAEHFGEEGAAEKLHLLGEVERCAADVMRPVLARHGLRPRDTAVLRESGRAYIARDKDRNWAGFIDHVVDFYPTYVVQFEALERMAPPDDQEALKRLTDHEHAAIAFAKREQAGDPASAESLRDYITLCEG